MHGDNLTVQYTDCPQGQMLTGKVYNIAVGTSFHIGAYQMADLCHQPIDFIVQAVDLLGQTADLLRQVR